MVTLRPTTEDDLPEIYDIYYQSEVGHEPDPPPRPEVFLDIRHEVRSGTGYVAERAGTIVGFATLTSRGRIAFLSSLFVREHEQSSGVGRLLLDRVLPRDGRLCCTLSSTDPRAIALYARAGMRPRWPNLLLRAIDLSPSAIPVADVEIVEGQAGDPELVRWDAAVCGRQREVDHAYWVEQERAMPLWFYRRGMRVGYGYVRLGAMSLRYADVAALGPIGVQTPGDATACVLAAVEWARQHAAVLRIDVPGPHPSLAPLLEAGFRIIDADTFCSAAGEPFADPCCYISSGGSLF